MEITKVMKHLDGSDDKSVSLVENRQERDRDISWIKLNIVLNLETFKEKG